MRLLRWLWVVCVATMLFAEGVQAGQAALPRVFAWSPQGLASVKARLASGDTSLQIALKRLVRDADKALQVAPESVTAKPQTPPSGDKHDYMSLAPYAWPDPTKPDGLPYVNRDGRINPEVDTIPDHRAMERMRGAVETLALAYYLTGNEAYASHAGTLLRTWFLDPATRMNPNLDYAQAEKGRHDGHSSGIIDTATLIRLVDSVGLLAGARTWQPEDQKGMEAWFGSYADWLVTSRNGRTEAKAGNNHGVWYDAQLASYALFAGKEALARKTVEAARLARIDAQIRSDGSMPRELARTKSWDYTLFNLEAFFALAGVAERLGVDLHGYQAPGGGSLRKALDFLSPYADPARKWDYPQIKEISMNGYAQLLHNAALIYHDPAYEALRARLDIKQADSARFMLLPAAVLK